MAVQRRIPYRSTSRRLAASQSINSLGDRQQKDGRTAATEMRAQVNLDLRLDNSLIKQLGVVNVVSQSSVFAFRIADHKKTSKKKF